MSIVASDSINSCPDAQFVLDLCTHLGFAAAGITPARPITYHHELRQWLADGQHGEMEYLARHVDLRIDPSVLMPGCKSIIVVADRHGPPDELGDSPRSPTGRIARYAQGADYHTVMKKRLHQLCDALRARWPGFEYRAAVDTAPIMEREHAARAGLGYIGKNTLLIQPGIGSYLMLGEVLTTLEVPQAGQPVIADHCGSCTRCIDACPTTAITPYSVDAHKCISYLTIEHRSGIDPQYYQAMGDWIFGCDICQQVCPHNGDTGPTQLAPTNPAYDSRLTGFNLMEILKWSDEDRRQAFAGSAMKRAKLDMMKRNAIIAAGNGGLADRLGPLVCDKSEPEVVRQTARHVIGT